MFSNQDIARYYDLSEDHYRFFWNLDQSKSLHYGYWDSSTKNFHEALLNINKILSSKAAICEGENVLDAGCGIGGSSLWLAREKKCKVTGISLSQKQIDKANAIVNKEGLNRFAHFELKDFTSTDFPDASFDVVWAIESVCHAGDKNMFIKEAYRVLKKGGRLIMADFFKKEGLKGRDAEIIQNWAHGWAVPDFSDVRQFKEGLTDAGFFEIEMEDATSAIRPSSKRLYYAYFIGLLGAKVYSLFNPHASDFGKKNINTAYLQYKGLQRDLWTYQLILARK